jgi:hypothetical protein
MLTAGNSTSTPHEHPQVERCPFPSFPESFVILLQSGQYLSDYSEHGSLETAELSSAKLFHHLFPAKDAAQILNGEVLRVLTDGVLIRIALFDKRVYEQRNLSEAKRLLFDFIGRYLGSIEIVGMQCGFGLTKDHIIFNHPSNRSSLTVPTDIMLLPEERARQIVRDKIDASTKAFAAARTR